MENCEIVIFQNGESVFAYFRLGLNLDMWAESDERSSECFSHSS